MLKRIGPAVLVLAALLFGCPSEEQSSGKTGDVRALSVAISPYQDIAMIVNAAPLGLEKKYGVRLDLRTMAWEDILPAIASAGRTVDVGFGSLIEYLTKQESLNAATEDPVLFVYPVYVFKGGAFVTFDPNIKQLNADALRDPVRIREFLSYRIGAQKSSVYEMIIYTLARRAGVSPKSVKLYDTPLNDGILAAQQGSLDIAEAGLTQITEAKKRGGRVLLTMEEVGFANVTGFLCKRSTLGRRRADIEKLVRMWFDSTRYVMTDLDKNSAESLAYLKRSAATQYTLEQYKAALSQEFFPLSVEEARRTLLADGAKYSVRRISRDVGAYLVAVKLASSAPPPPDIIDVK